MSTAAEISAKMRLHMKLQTSDAKNKVDKYTPLQTTKGSWTFVDSSPQRIFLEVSPLLQGAEVLGGGLTDSTEGLGRA